MPTTEKRIIALEEKTGAKRQFINVIMPIFDKSGRGLMLIFEVQKDGSFGNEHREIMSADNYQAFIEQQEIPDDKPE